jgi:HEAT repeats/PBS lyase HEAT-like repeat
LAVITVISPGCAGTWDKISSRRFREKPIGTLWDNRDPLTVMRDNPEGDERAAAMRKLKEPAANGRSAQEQDEALKLLTDAALNDTSPVVRVAAIDGLGRFRDPRVVKSLTAAYYQSTGTTTPAAANSPIQQAGARITAADRYSLNGPTGFAPEITSLLRSRVVESLSNTGSSEAIPMLAQIATGSDKTLEGDRDTRLAAVRGLQTMRSPESVQALSKVLTIEKTRDPAMAGRAHEGLVALTGQSLPDDPQKWDQYVRSGTAVVAPTPNIIQQVGSWVFGN